VTLCGECKTFWLAIQIVEPPRINERCGAATRREIIEPRNCGGLVTEQIETTIRTSFEITEVGAGLGQVFCREARLREPRTDGSLFGSASARHQPVHRHGVSPATANLPGQIQLEPRASSPWRRADAHQAGALSLREVIAVGPGVRDESGKLVPLDLKAGDRVLFGKWSGTEVKIDGQDLLIMKESDIMGVIEGASAAKKKAA
jgi:co-chaperonin GroES (HSP10)